MQKLSRQAAGDARRERRAGSVIHGQGEQRSGRRQPPQQSTEKQRSAGKAITWITTEQLVTTVPVERYRDIFPCRLADEKGGDRRRVAVGFSIVADDLRQDLFQVGGGDLRVMIGAA